MKFEENLNGYIIFKAEDYYDAKQMNGNLFAVYDGKTPIRGKAAFYGNEIADCRAFVRGLNT